MFALPGLGASYTITTGGTRFRSTPRIARELCPKREKTEGARDHRGTVSSTQASYMVIASCVESGDTVGVATALVGEGPSTLFWMWAAAFLGIATEYAEIVLGLVFRQKSADGNYYGGPVYYIEKGLHVRLLGVAAAVLLFFQNAGGTLIQSNTISDVVFQVFGVSKVVTGTLMAAVMVFIIGGGPERPMDVAQKIMPVMASLYIVGGTMVVFTDLDSILPIFRSILQDACPMKVGMGTTAGLTVKEAVRFGAARGLYSNEAGERSAAVTHSAAQVDHPARQGLYGVVEVFVDTMVICSTTGFPILVSGVSLEGTSMTLSTVEAFGTITPLFKYMASISLISFAPASAMSQWYFSHVSLMYVKSLRGSRLYRILFLVLILLGSLNTIGIVRSAQDCMLGPLVIPNVLALLKLSPVVMRMTRESFRENQ